MQSSHPNFIPQQTPSLQQQQQQQPFGVQQQNQSVPLNSMMVAPQMVSYQQQQQPQQQHPHQHPHQQGSVPLAQPQGTVVMMQPPQHPQTMMGMMGGQFQPQMMSFPHSHMQQYQYQQQPQQSQTQYQQPPPSGFYAHSQQQQQQPAGGFSPLMQPVPASSMNSIIHQPQVFQQQYAPAAPQSQLRPTTQQQSYYPPVFGTRGVDGRSQPEPRVADRSSGRAEQGDRRTCHFCGDYGHLLRDCPKVAASGLLKVDAERGAVLPDGCWGCGKVGHMSRNCPLALAHLYVPHASVVVGTKTNAPQPPPIAVNSQLPPTPSSDTNSNKNIKIINTPTSASGSQGCFYCGSKSHQLDGCPDAKIVASTTGSGAQAQGQQ